MEVSHVSCTYMYIYTHVNTHIFAIVNTHIAQRNGSLTWRNGSPVAPCELYMCMYIYTYVHTNIFKFIYVYTYVYLYIYI